MQEIQEMWVRSLGQENPLEEGMATYSSILAWRIPQRSLAGYSPKGNKESNTEWLSMHTIQVKFKINNIKVFSRSMPHAIVDAYLH